MRGGQGSSREESILRNSAWTGVLVAVAWMASAAAWAQQMDRIPDAPVPVPKAVNAQPGMDSGDAHAPVFAWREPLKANDEPMRDVAAAGSMRGPAGWGVASAWYPGLASSMPGAHLDLAPMLREMDRPAQAGDGMGISDRYNTKGLLWQSLAFIGTENTWRLFTDRNMRGLIAGKPYWHDYIESMKQWNMRRWWDGDSILVDDIGHPMQGGVSAFIEIQNSPRQRKLRFEMSKEYWRSRMLAMLWATAYSTQQKIGPLGEAALGSDGGITYPLNCPYPCRTYVPGVGKYTNNTGWTDFIMTPVVGTVWVLMEDYLDLKVSDRLQAGREHSWWPKVIRGTLNPTRTMANAMRWRKPWYRDFQQDANNPHMTRVPHLVLGDEEVMRAAPRFEVFPHYNAIWLPVNTVRCTNCRQLTGGYGVGFSARLTRWLDFDSDVESMANASPLPSDRAGGNATMGTFGFRSGLTYARYSVKAAVRPGFLSYDRAYETSPVAGGPTPSIGRITHFATALAINADYVVARRLALRAVVGNTPVRYRLAYQNPPGVGTPPYLNWLSHQNFMTNENWTFQTGAVLRF